MNRRSWCFHKNTASGRMCEHRAGLDQGVKMLQPSTKSGIAPTQGWGKRVVGLDGRVVPFPEGFSIFFPCSG